MDQWSGAFGLGARICLLAAVVAASACDGSGEFPETQARRFEDALTQMHESQGAVGSLLIVDDGERTYLGALGLADRATGREMTIDTPYLMASVAKTFVSALVLSLHEEGALSVDDPLAAHVDGVPGAERITLRMLLTHTSGIANYTKTPGYQGAIALDPTRDFTDAELISFALEAGPDFEPGEGWNYCNTGFLLLAAVAESITGRSFSVSVSERFFEPLGMRDTYPWPAGPLGDDLARGYLPGASMPEAVLHRAPPASGGFVTTLRDMRTWSRAFLGGRLHAPATLALARETEGGELLDTVARSFGLERGGYGLGFVAAEDAVLGTLLGGAGNADGMRTFTGYLPEHDLAFALFVNVGSSQVPLVETLAAVAPVLGALRDHVSDAPR